MISIHLDKHLQLDQYCKCKEIHWYLDNHTKLSEKRDVEKKISKWLKEKKKI